MLRIKESKTADSRTAEGEVTKEQLLESSCQHRDDVKKGLAFFSDMLHTCATNHDLTKISCINTFHDSFSKSLKDKDYDFDKSLWYQMHVTEERHHMKERCPDDVNLIDVLEHVADIVMAGMGRSGKVYSSTMPAGILERAYQNTIKLLTEQVEVEK